MTEIIHNIPTEKTVTYGSLPVGTIFTITNGGDRPRTFVKLATQGTYCYKARCISDYTFVAGEFTSVFSDFKVVTRVEFHYD